MTPNVLATNTTSQRQRIIEHLRQHGSINTMEMRELLNITVPSARIFELRAQGFKIEARYVDLPDAWGRLHKRCAQYHLIDDGACDVGGAE